MISALHPVSLKALLIKSAKFVKKLSCDQVDVNLLPTEPVLMGIGTNEHDHLFDITNDAADVEDMSHRLACLAKAMIDKIENLCKVTSFRFDQKFRLEFRPVSFYNSAAEALHNNHWELRMNLDPIAWFDWKWSDASPSYDGQREFLVIARDYVDKYKNFVHDEFLDAPKHKPLSTNHGTSNQPSSALLSCDEHVMGRQQHGGRCGHYISGENVAMEWPICSGQRYILSERQIRTARPQLSDLGFSFI
jgi:hypothetical protein